MSNTSMSKKFEVLPKIINGSLGALISLLCIFPLDLVKTRLQNQQRGPKGEKQYTSIADCFLKTYRAEGFLGMYRGLTVSLLLATPEKAIKLASNDYFRYQLTRADGRLPLTYQMLAGSLAGALQVVVATPMEVIKIQQQDYGRVYHDKHAIKRITATKVFLYLYKKRGFFGLYHGTGPTMMRDIWFSLVFFPTFAYINEIGPRKEGSKDAASWVSFIGGLVSGCVSAFVATPLDVVKTRLQALTKRHDEQKFNGIFDCFRKTYENEGLRALFKGGLCRVIVISPLYGIVQTIYYLGVGDAIVGFFRTVE